MGVVVVGAGMSGVFTAVQLKKLGIDVIILEKSSRPGNSWRTRYHAPEIRFPRTALGDESFSPPADWPEFISPVEMANWIEGYAVIMGLDIVRLILNSPLYLVPFTAIRSGRTLSLTPEMSHMRMQPAFGNLALHMMVGSKRYAAITSYWPPEPRASLSGSYFCGINIIPGEVSLAKWLSRVRTLLMAQLCTQASIEVKQSGMGSLQ